MFSIFMYLYIKVVFFEKNRKTKPLTQGEQRKGREKKEWGGGGEEVRGTREKKERLEK